MFLQAEEMSESRRFATAKLLITVKPVDSNPPKISVTAVEGVVDENSAVGTQVMDIQGNPIILTVADADLVITRRTRKGKIFFRISLECKENNIGI